MKSALDDCALYCTKEMRKEQKKRDMSHGDYREQGKHLITAAPGTLDLSRKILSSPCLIALDGCWSLMHDNAGMSPCFLPLWIPVSLHSRWWAWALDLREGMEGGQVSEPNLVVGLVGGIPHRSKAIYTLMYHSMGSSLQDQAPTPHFSPHLQYIYFPWEKNKTRPQHATGQEVCDPGTINWQHASLLCSQLPLSTCLRLDREIWITLE